MNARRCGAINWIMALSPSDVSFVQISGHSHGKPLSSTVLACVAPVRPEGVAFGDAAQDQVQRDPHDREIEENGKHAGYVDCGLTLYDEAAEPAR